FMLRANISLLSFFFFSHMTSTPSFYTLSLHDALPISLRRSPILSAAAIFSLGVAIGANTAFFGVMDAVLSRSLPVQEPEQLVERDRKSTRLNSSHVAISYAVFCLKKKKPNYQLETQTG